MDAGIRDSSWKIMYSKKGYNTTPVTRTGTMIFAVYLMNVISNAPARTRLVGLEDTSIADAIFAQENCVKIQALGCLMLLDTRVIYDRKAVPDRITGSFPMKAVRRKKKAYR
jgi:hypothetical protein